jgi:arylsulfatase A-like enzyme
MRATSSRPTSLGRRDFLGLTGSALAAAVGAPAILTRAREPNLLFILADDLGYGDLSSFGRPDYQTPVLDRLAASGVRFTNAYSAASVCTPTRAGFMTGRYPERLPAGLQQPMSWVIDQEGLGPEQPTIATQLKARDYETALIGKWHLGYRPEYGPIRHGFDEFFGILSGGVDYFTHRDATRRLGLYEGLVTVEKTGYMTDLLTNRAVEYVSRQRRRPFYLSLQYTAPHWPWQGPGDHLTDTSMDGFQGGGGSPKVYARMVQSLDTGVGRVLDALSKNRIERNTLVIFTSDNGGERYSYNWPHQEGKGTLWEGGIRVPAMMRWPGVIPGGGVSDQIAISMDWTATLMAAGGAQAKTGYPLDGVDLLPVANRGRRPMPRTLFWRQPGLRYNGQPPQAAVRQGRWKYLDVNGERHLFDIVSDPGERKNLREAHPEVARELGSALARWEADLPPRL